MTLKHILFGPCSILKKLWANIKNWKILQKKKKKIS